MDQYLIKYLNIIFSFNKFNYQILKFYKLNNKINYYKNLVNFSNQVYKYKILEILI